ncbi:MAG: hypothetical protein Q9215_001295 [Flavoplaca cf. flavocitrina]
MSSPAVAGNYLYIEGGEISYILGDSVVNQYASNTLSIDLSQDWVNSSVVFNSITKPAGAPLLSDSSLWYDQDNDIFYSGFTGRSSLFGDQPDPPPISVWSFKPDGAGGGSWKVDISPDDPKWSRRTRTDWGYTASGGGSALVLGGVLNPWTTPASMNVKEDVLVPGLIEFNMTKKGFYNSSATGFNAKGVGGRGAMHYVPSFGPNGLFLVMGGTDFSDPDQNIAFDNIWVYETLENRWYNQTATGSLPAGRRNFCLAGIASTNETYEISLRGLRRPPRFPTTKSSSSLSPPSTGSASPTYHSILVTATAATPSAAAKSSQSAASTPTPRSQPDTFNPRGRARSTRLEILSRRD